MSLRIVVAEVGFAGLLGWWCKAAAPKPLSESECECGCIDRARPRPAQVGAGDTADSKPRKLNELGAV